MTYTISNDALTLSLDEQGRLLELSAPGIPNVIAAPRGLFRAVVHQGDNWECVAWGEEQEVRVSARDQALVVTCEHLRTWDRTLPIGITLTISLQNDRVLFASEIDNRSDGTVTDWVYPRIGAVKALDGENPDLLLPRHLGERYVRVGEFLKNYRSGLREGTRTLSESYPGFLSMQWLMLTGKRSVLYLSGRDDLFHTSFERAVGSEAGDVTLEMDKLGFIKPGERWQCPDYILQLYTGSWRRAADEYRSWADTWRRPVRPKEWLRRMNGYFLVINKQQYGDEVWPYETIPQLYEYAQDWGFDTLGLFGWYHTGHDNHYPDLDVSPTMGGAEKLTEGIRAVQAKGGHVTLYYQGHLMDVGTRFYRETGHRLEGKSRWGTPYYEYYDKYCASDFLRAMSKKPFATVCPTCAEWQELMAQRADWIHSFGADGVLYDQIGGMPPYPCHDERHGHLQNRPSLSHAQGRIALHKRIRAQVDAHPEFGYMTEHVTDVHSQFIDCLHGIGSYPGAQGTDAAGPGTCNWDMPEAGVRMMPELFRYTFPETLITVRNPAPVLSRRFANYAVFYGFKFEMELRYLTDRTSIGRDEFAADRVYSKQAAELRNAQRKYLLEGRFLSDEGLAHDQPFVKACRYQAEDGSLAAVLWNDQLTDQPIGILKEALGDWNAWATAEASGDDIHAEIPAQSVMILYKK